jgi:ATP-binding cassette subfamily B protein
MNPRLLILDDATSNVDARVEALIRRGLEQAMAGRTTVIVARRPQTAALADRVAYMEAGRIVAVGTHEELWRSIPGYRDTLLTGADIDSAAGAIDVTTPEEAVS